MHAVVTWSQATKIAPSRTTMTDIDVRKTSSHGTADYLVRGMVTRSDNCHCLGPTAIKMSLGN